MTTSHQHMQQVRGTGRAANLYEILTAKIEAGRVRDKLTPVAFTVLVTEDYVSLSFADKVDYYFAKTEIQDMTPLPIVFTKRQ